MRNVEHGRAMALATFTVTGACDGRGAQPAPHAGRVDHLRRHDPVLGAS